MATPTLSHIHSVREHLGDTLSAHPNELVALFSRFVNQGKGMLLPHQLLAEYEAVIPEVDREKLKDGVFEDVLKAAQEAIILPPWVALAIRPKPGVWEYVWVNVSELAIEELTVPEYLQFKEELVDGSSQNNFVLELDFEPFNASFPPPLSITGRPPPRQHFQILISRLGRRKALYLCCLQTGRKEEVYLKKEEACGKKNGLWLSTGRRRKKRACGS